jgi:ParB-like chromosome segregation protein Spo0J
MGFKHSTVEGLVAKKTAARGGAAKTAAAGKRALSWIVEGLRPLAVPIDSIKLDPENENTHNEASLAAIAASLKRFKQRTPIVVNKKTTLISKGNGTWQAAKKNGETMIAVVFVEDDPKSHAGYRLADNRAADLSEWDTDRLAASIEALADEDQELFSALSLDALAESLPEAGEGEGEDPPAVQVPEHYAILIEVKNEREQKKLYDRLTTEGLKCKLQTL